ncbi:MAG: extracellular solute-binding protein [Paracoccaceae bacterium]
MRRRLFAALSALFAWTTGAFAFEIEAETTFPAATATVELRIISTADSAFFTPAVLNFQAAHANIAVTYVEASSTEAVKAISEGASFDLIVSSAMDLQTKLANDGFATVIRSSATSAVPEWAKWRDSVFAFTQEPATLVLSPTAFDGLPVPETRKALIEILREHPDRFRGRIGTYDIRQSGLGYLFATQDSRTSETYWRLTEVMGGLATQLYCCSLNMIEAVRSGELALAYNVLGSYARLPTVKTDDLVVIELADYTATMQRSILMLRNSENPDAARLFVDHLLSTAWSTSDEPAFGFSAELDPDDISVNRKPIRLGPGLLVFLDQHKRGQFQRAWENAILQ